MRKKIKIIFFIMLTIPLLYVLQPIANGFGCDYKSEVETENLLITGVCHRGVLRTITHFKDSGLTIGNTMIVAYREPYLITVSVNKSVISPPLLSNSVNSLHMLRDEYLTPVIKRFHVKRSGNNYIFLLRPSSASFFKQDIIYKVNVDGMFAYWE